jgi:fatty acid CoA ligase FadD9
MKGGLVTSDVSHEVLGYRELPEGRRERRALRIAGLYANDPQFSAAEPRSDVLEAVRRPGVRLAEILQTVFEAYGSRPALGERLREFTTDPATGRTSARLLHRFGTMSYRDVWSRVRAIATAWSHDTDYPVQPGDFVATVGFASPEYLIVDLACAYLGLVSVPLQHNALVSRLAPILAETEPRVLAVSAEYLDLAVESALDITSLRHLVVFDYQPGVDDHRDGMKRAHELLRAAGRSVTIHTIGEIVARGAELPPEPIYTAGNDDRLAMILYTSGSTGTPKGAMYTERMVAGSWISSFATDADVPVFNVNFMPLNHLRGRLPLTSSFQVGGVSYFVPESDMSTLFEDWALVRPTELGLVPRVVDMLFHRYRSVVDHRVTDGLSEGEAEESAAVEIRETVLGGRVLAAWVGTAPLAGDMRVFLESVLDLHVLDGYGLTEVGGVLKTAS